MTPTREECKALVLRVLLRAKPIQSGYQNNDPGLWTAMEIAALETRNRERALFDAAIKLVEEEL